MKKPIKVVLIILGAILAIAVSGIAILMFIGPSEPIILTKEQEAEENAQQSKLYSTVDLTGFNTVAITGEKITSDYFKDYKITMINIWITDCGPCIDEMPDIAMLYNNKPDGSNIISICKDTVNDKGAVKFANKVMSDANAKFLTLIPDAVVQKSLTDKTHIFPTTIFVDSNGKVVGNPHFGGRTQDDYKQAILDRIELLEKAE